MITHHTVVRRGNQYVLYKNDARTDDWVYAADRKATADLFRKCALLNNIERKAFEVASKHNLI